MDAYTICGLLENICCWQSLVESFFGPSIATTCVTSQFVTRNNFVIHKRPTQTQAQTQAQVSPSINSHSIFQPFEFFETNQYSMASNDLEGQSIIDDINKLISMIDEFQSGDSSAFIVPSHDIHTQARPPPDSFAPDARPPGQRYVSLSHVVY